MAAYLYVLVFINPKVSHLGCIQQNTFVDCMQFASEAVFPKMWNTSSKIAASNIELEIKWT
jgi:hypothetical protein